jgi:hypothetical protein
MKKKLLITGVAVVVSLVALGLYVRLTNDNRRVDYARAELGWLEITVEAMGELVAENSIDIKGPNLVGNRRLRSGPIRITDMVPEGTTVREGDFIAELDRSNFVNTLKDEQDELREDQTKYDTKVLDTAVVLSQLRDEIRNQQFVAAEAEITLEQSKFEPPATIRQAEITLDKSRRTLEQKKRQYELKRAQIRTELLNIRASVNRQQRVVDDITAVLAGFTVRAPRDGMVIYKKDRLGQKIKTGTSISPWDPVVATLPDMSSMLTRMYISEIEINKVDIGLPVEIRVDAFPDRYFKGTIFQIANIGEQLPNSDSKVFEVLAKITVYDPLLRPSMTTSNKVVVNTFRDVIYVPNESVHAGMDSVPYVFTKDRIKQIVVLGKSNDDYIIVEQGLQEGTPVWLSIPENAEKFTLAGQELIPVILERERELARIEAERIKSHNDNDAVQMISGEYSLE